MLYISMMQPNAVSSKKINLIYFVWIKISACLHMKSYQSHDLICRLRSDNFPIGINREEAMFAHIFLYWSLWELWKEPLPSICIWSNEYSKLYMTSKCPQTLILLASIFLLLRFFISISLIKGNIFLQWDSSKKCPYITEKVYVLFKGK